MVIWTYGVQYERFVPLHPFKGQSVTFVGKSFPAAVQPIMIRVDSNLYGDDII